MYASTHIAFGVVFYFFWAVVGYVAFFDNPWAYPFLVLGALLPDMDTSVSLTGRLIRPVSSWVEKHYGHRTFTHSFLGMGFFFVIFSFLLLFDVSVYVAFCLGYVSHLLVDCLNKEGVPFLFPKMVWFVIPGRKRYRIKVGSRAEKLFCAGCIVVAVLMSPLAKNGLYRSLHLLLKDIGSAVKDVQVYAPDYLLSADMSGVDNLTLDKIEGTFPILGWLTNTSLVIQKEGISLRVGSGTSDNVKPERIVAVKDASVSIVTQEIDMSNSLLGDIKLHMDPDKHQVVRGSLVPVEDPDLGEDIHVYNPVTLKNGRVDIELATYGDFISFAASDELQGQRVYIKEGSVFLITRLKRGETLDNIQDKKSDRFIDTFKVTFTIENKNEVLVQKGQHVSKGDVIAQIDRNIRKQEEAQQDIQNHKHQLDILNKRIEEYEDISVQKLDKFIRDSENLKVKQVDLEDEKKREIALLRRRIKSLEEEKEFHRRNWDKIQELKTSDKIEETNVKVADIREDILRIPVIIEDEKRLLEEKKSQFLYDSENKKHALFQDRMDLQAKLDKLINDEEQLNSKSYIVSPVDALVSTVKYHMSVENLTRVNIVLLVDQNKGVQDAERTENS